MVTHLDLIKTLTDEDFNKLLDKMKPGEYVKFAWEPCGNCIAARIGKDTNNSRLLCYAHRGPC